MKAKRIPPGLTETGRKSGGCESPCSKDDYTTHRTELQEIVLSFLHSGASNAVTLRDIRNATGLDGRAVRLAIREARLRGVPVVSDNERGYWISSDSAEIRRFVHSMRHRAREIAAVAEAVGKAVAT